MKKVIELLKTARAFAACGGSYSIIVNCIEEAIAELKAPPRWETPEQWEQRTGEPWPDDWPVWDITDGMIGISTMGEEEERKKWGNHIYVIATEAGPPPDDWRPEEDK